MMMLNESFVHPSIELLLISDKQGNGYEAKQVIPKGTLIIQTPAYAKILYSEVKTLLTNDELKNFHPKQLPLTSAGLLVQKIYQNYSKALENADSKIIDLMFPKISSLSSFLASLPTDQLNYINQIVDFVLPRINSTSTSSNSTTNNTTNNATNNSSSATYTSTNSSSLKEQLQRLACIVTFNPHTIDLDSGVTIGIGFYLSAWFFNHSCWPNCVSYTLLDGSYLFSRCIRDIQPGEQLTISYCELYLSRRDRKLFLQSSYNLDCKCERCEEKVFRERDEAVESINCIRKSDNDNNNNNNKDNCEHGRMLLENAKTDIFSILKFREGWNLAQFEKELTGSEYFKCTKCGIQQPLILKSTSSSNNFSDLYVKFKYLYQMFLKAKEYKSQNQFEKSKEMYDGLIKFSNDSNFLHPLNILLFNSYTDLISLTDALLTINAEKIDELQKHQKAYQNHRNNLHSQHLHSNNNSNNHEQLQDRQKDLQELMTKVVELTRDLLNYARQGFWCARLILPPNVSELAGFLRAEYKSLMQLAQFTVNKDQREVLLKAAQESYNKSKEIWRNSRSGEEELELLKKYSEVQKIEHEKKKLEEEKNERVKDKKRENRKKNRQRRNRKKQQQKQQTPTTSAHADNNTSNNNTNNTTNNNTNNNSV